MTVIAAVKANDHIIIAADSYVTDGDTISLINKLIRHNDSVYSVAGHAALFDVVRETLEEKAMAKHNIKCLRDARNFARAIWVVYKKLKKSYGLNDAQDDQSDSLVMASPWGIWQVDRFGVIQEAEQYAVVGAGHHVAEGSLFTTFIAKNLEEATTEEVAEAVELAILCACERHPSCREPVNMEILKRKRGKK